MSQIVFFGIDLGTTNTKVIAVKESGEFIASARRATDWIVLPNGRIEADANLLYKKVVDRISLGRMVDQKLTKRQIRYIIIAVLYMAGFAGAIWINLQ